MALSVWWRNNDNVSAWVDDTLLVHLRWGPLPMDGCDLITGELLRRGKAGQVAALLSVVEADAPVVDDKVAAFRRERLAEFGRFPNVLLAGATLGEGAQVRLKRTMGTLLGVLLPGRTYTGKTLDEAIAWLVVELGARGHKVSADDIVSTAEQLRSLRFSSGPGPSGR
jgi:hypothetical protein